MRLSGVNLSNFGGADTGRLGPPFSASLSPPPLCISTAQTAPVSHMQFVVSLPFTVNFCLHERHVETSTHTIWNYPRQFEDDTAHPPAIIALFVECTVISFANFNSELASA